MIAICGSGGKSTAVKHIALQLKARSKIVLCLTTTKMGVDQLSFCDEHFETIQDCFKAFQCEQQTSKTISIYQSQGQRITTCFEPLSETMHLLRILLTNQQIRIVYEADGAKMLPLKYHHGDPVFLPFPQVVYSIVGLSSLQKPLKDVCFRCQEFLDKYNLSGEQLVNIEVLKYFTQDYTDQFNRWDGSWRNKTKNDEVIQFADLEALKQQSQTILVLNQIDTVDTNTLEDLKKSFANAIFGVKSITAL